MKTSLLALVLLGTAAQAADTVNITVSGTLTRPPCVLTSGTSSRQRSVMCAPTRSPPPIP